MSLQTFGCHMLTLSLVTNTAFTLWTKWIELCDPNLSPWITKESAIETMETIWSGFINATVQKMNG
jgi:hypothetical protein